MSIRLRPCLRSNPVYKYTCSLQTPLPVYLRASLCSAVSSGEAVAKLTASRCVFEQGRVNGTRRHADVAHDGSTDEHVLDSELGISSWAPRQLEIKLTMCGYFSGSSTRMPSSRMLRNLESAGASWLAGARENPYCVHEVTMNVKLTGRRTSACR